MSAGWAGTNAASIHLGLGDFLRDLCGRSLRSSRLKALKLLTAKPAKNNRQGRKADRAYNSLMARGWESKSVEAQQADAAEKSGPHRTPLTPLQAARQRELEGLRLSRQNLLQQLERAKDARHRRMLEDALAELLRRMEQPAS